MNFGQLTFIVGEVFISLLATSSFPWTGKLETLVARDDASILPLSPAWKALLNCLIGLVSEGSNLCLACKPPQSHGYGAGNCIQPSSPQHSGEQVFKSAECESTTNTQPSTKTGFTDWQVRISRRGIRREDEVM